MFDSTDLRTLRGAYGTTNSQRYPGVKPCNALYVYNSSLYSVLLSTGNPSWHVTYNHDLAASPELQYVQLSFELFAIQKLYIRGVHRTTHLNNPVSTFLR